MLTSSSFLCSQQCHCSIKLQTTAQSWDIRVRRCLSMSFSFDDSGNAVVGMQKVLWNLRETFLKIQVLSPFLRCNLLISMEWYTAKLSYFLFLYITWSQNSTVLSKIWLSIGDGRFIGSPKNCLKDLLQHEWNWFWNVCVCICTTEATYT